MDYVPETPASHVNSFESKESPDSILRDQLPAISITPGLRTVFFNIILVGVVTNISTRDIKTIAHYCPPHSTP